MTCGNCDGNGSMPDGSACTNMQCQGGMIHDPGLGVDGKPGDMGDMG